MTSIGRVLTCLILSVFVSGAAWAQESSLGNSVIEARFKSLEAEVATLRALLAGVSRGTDTQTGQDTLQFSGMNVQIVNGGGFSNFNTVPNGTGNLIIGYNEPNTTGQPNERTGSHMLVVGFGQNYTSFGGIVAGADNTIRGRWSSILGGTENTVSGNLNSISAGFRNSADGFATSVSGGLYNSSIARFSSISGGGFNRTEGVGAVVSGGFENEVFGRYSSILGGTGNLIDGFRATISGGEQNFVGGYAATVSGGFNNGSHNDHSNVAGGRDNTAAATGATVSGGQFKTAASEGCVAGDSVLDGGNC